MASKYLSLPILTLITICFPEVAEAQKLMGVVYSILDAGTGWQSVQNEDNLCGLLVQSIPGRGILENNCTGLDSIISSQDMNDYCRYYNCEDQTPLACFQQLSAANSLKNLNLICLIQAKKTGRSIYAYDAYLYNVRSKKTDTLLLEYPGDKNYTDLKLVDTILVLMQKSLCCATLLRRTQEIQENYDRNNRANCQQYMHEFTGSSSNNQCRRPGEESYYKALVWLLCGSDSSGAERLLNDIYLGKNKADPVLQQKAGTVLKNLIGEERFFYDQARFEKWWAMLDPALQKALTHQNGLPSTPNTGIRFNMFKTKFKDTLILNNLHATSLQPLLELKLIKIIKLTGTKPVLKDWNIENITVDISDRGLTDQDKLEIEKRLDGKPGVHIIKK